ncbi:hypothetical protein F5Y06DRAFT_302258 [Hypoxylon sp. FL0890]|nr:hypothetical protein F5Y06DRAFT_302258 [Hypoxylon sp. FL0890]
MAPGLDAWKNISTRLHKFRNRRGHDSTEDKQLLDKTTALATTSKSAGPAQSEKAPEVSSQPSTAVTLQEDLGLPKPSLQNPLENKAGTSAMSSSPLFVGHSKESHAGKASYARTSDSTLSHEPTIDDHPLGSQYNPIDLTTNTSFDQTYESFPFYDHSTPSFQEPNMSTKTYPKLPSGYPSIFTNPSLPPSVYPTTLSAQNVPLPTQPWNFAGLASGNFVPAPLPGYLPPHGIWANSQIPPTVCPWFKQAKLYGSHLPALEPAGGQNTLADMASAQFEGSSWDHKKSNPLIHLQSNHASEASGQAVDADSPEEIREPSVGPEQLPGDADAINLALKELEPLQRFVHGCLTRNCSKCTKNKTMDAKDVVKMTTGWARRAGIIVLGATCQNVFCTVSTCLGCGEPISFGMNASHTLEIPGANITVHWCCDSGRLGAIWALACGWDVSYKSQARSFKNVLARTHVKPASTSRSQSPQANAKGVGYGSSRPEFLPLRSQGTSRMTPRDTNTSQEHILQQAYFRLLAALLPSNKRKTAFDASPPDFLLHMLSRSPLLEKAAIMLSNDSIGEISRQYQLYDAMLGLFDALGSHPSTATLVYNDRNLYYAKGGSLLEVSMGPVEGNGRIVVRDTGRPLIALLRNLATQSQTVLRHAQGNQMEFHSREGVELLKLSQRLSEISTQHMANMHQLQTSMEITDNSLRINFSEWHRENCVRDVPDETIMRDFACVRGAALGGMFTANPAHGRMKRLITELSTLQTSLPEGIFIYYGSSRLDIMKVLIIGPKNTPYEHGLFEFDLWCPMDYPNSPPKMTFRTTNGGRTRFNPNLYEDGKICLSLLGTWSGEPWRASQSTLLQVLVSIQSMILCEQPWYNEPGREDYENKAQSARYNNDVRTWTMQYALLPWINATGTHNTDQGATTTASIWQETAQLYLRANGKDILHSSKQASLKSKKSALLAAVKHISTSLQEKGYLD